MDCDVKNDKLREKIIEENCRIDAADDDIKPFTGKDFVIDFNFDYDTHFWQYIGTLLLALIIAVALIKWIGYIEKLFCSDGVDNNKAKKNNDIDNETCDNSTVISDDIQDIINNIKENDNSSTMSLISIDTADIPLKDLAPEYYNDKKDIQNDQKKTENCGRNKSYNDGLISKMKQAQIRKLEAQLSEEQLKEERRIENEQLQQIYSMIKKQEQDFKLQELNPDELANQMKLYR